MPTDDSPAKCGTERRLKPTGHPKAGTGMKPKWLRSELAKRSGYVRINARRNRSGTSSVLMEPCRKKSRSRRDQSGTCPFVVTEVRVAFDSEVLSAALTWQPK